MATGRAASDFSYREGMARIDDSANAVQPSGFKRFEVEAIELSRLTEVKVARRISVENNRIMEHAG